MNTRQLHAGDDLSEATLLLQRFFAEEHFDTPPETITANTQRMAQLSTCGLFLAEQDSQAVGVATVSLEFGIEYGWSAEMGDLYVLPEFRGRGVSRLLIVAIEDFLRAKGAAGYQVTVTPFAEQAHKMRDFYVKLGFADEGRQLLYRKLS